MIHTVSHISLLTIYMLFTIAGIYTATDPNVPATVSGSAGISYFESLPLHKTGDDNRVSVSFLSGQPRITEPGIYWIGLYMDIEEGWHVYWRNPGDSGLPTEIRWGEHDLVNPGIIHWPQPSRFDEDGITTYGYSEETTLLVPLEIKPGITDEGRSIALPADINWLVCKDICLTEFYSLTLETDPDGNFKDYSADMTVKLEKAEAKLPGLSPDWQAESTFRDDLFELRITPVSNSTSRPDPENVYFFPYNRGTIDHTAPQKVKWIDNTMLIELKASAYLNTVPDEMSGLLVSDESWMANKELKAMEISFSVSAR